MRLSRVFVDLPLSIGAEINLPQDKSHYLTQVLRLKDGQPIILFNGRDNQDYHARIEHHGKKSLSARIERGQSKHNEPMLSITLVQAIGKNEAVESCIQKSTELGVSHILLFNGAYTQFPLKSIKWARKLEHWRKITESACEQCGRNKPARIQIFNSLHECIDQLPPANRLLLDFDAPALKEFPQHSCSDPFQILIGPEGGLSESEKQHARQEGFAPRTIGPRVLRMETAAIAAISLVQHLFGDM